MSAILILLLFAGIYALFHLLKTQDAQSKVHFINSHLSKTLIQSENPEPKLYDLYLITRVDNLRRDVVIRSLKDVRYDGPLRVDISLIHFSVKDGNFQVKSTDINYNLDELYTIFTRASRTFGVKQQIYVNWGSNHLTILPTGSIRIIEIEKLNQLFLEFQQIENDISHLEKEEEKAKALISTIESSDLYRYQIDTYRRGLSQLEKLKSKAISIKNNYLTYLRECFLDFYITNVGSSTFQVTNKELTWEAKFKEFREDYNFLKSKMNEYRKL